MSNGKKLEARVGIEPTHKGFADLSLTTWVPRPALTLAFRPGKVHGLGTWQPQSQKIWSGRRGSNPRHRPWQGRALPLSYSRSSFHFTALALWVTIRALALAPEAQRRRKHSVSVMAEYVGRKIQGKLNLVTPIPELRYLDSPGSTKVSTTPAPLQSSSRRGRASRCGSCVPGRPELVRLLE